MDRAFACCESCGEAAPEATLPLGFRPALESAVLLDGGRDFGRRHEGHPVCRLLAGEGADVSESPYGAAARATFLDVRSADGSRRVLEARREAPGAPVAYRVRPGRLVRTRQTIRVDTAAVGQVLGEAIGRPGAAPEAAVAVMADLARTESEAVGFDLLEARAVAGPTPLVAHAPLPAGALPGLFDAARRLVARGVLPRALSPRVVARLVALHAAPGGAFAPVLETGYALVGPTGAVEGHFRRVRERAA